MSPFLDIPQARWLASNGLAFAVSDAFPVSPGHALVITRRIVPTWFDATPDEQRAVMELVGEVKAILERTLTPRPEGWNIGMNAGVAAGQTVPHLHVHVIPRWAGDVADPRGGVRHVIPGKGDYLDKPGAGMADLCTGHPDDPFLRRLVAELPGASEVDILASFVQPSGVELVEPELLRALAGGAVVRLLAGDYLGISSPTALRSLLALAGLRDERWRAPARLELRVLEIARADGGPASFHPKAWRIARPERTVVWVGSSNLSAAALVDGIEWNLRATSHERADACVAVAQAFDRLWAQASAIDAAWIDAYACRVPRRIVVEAEPDPEPVPQPPAPRPWQVEVLACLAALRADGHRRALAAVATGMGKTVLAALDAARAVAEGGVAARVIVIAHRAELLAQSSRTLRHALGWGGDVESWCLGAAGDLSGRLVLASVQKLARPEMLERLGAERFAYAIVDEVHHAEAPTWRRVLDRLDAGFVLGLTATPERADGRDVAPIFDDVLACEIGIAAGIRAEALVPFAYHGLKDDVDYERIPWRNGRFDEAELEGALLASPRMERLWRAWQEHPGGRTIVFCVGQRHARFARDWLRSRGVAAAAVYSGAGSDDRGEALAALAAGRLHAVCAVDLFNEGIDVPAVDRVVMLRPTESSVVFTQQLGRGLRTADGKRRLVVIDFVGNHRVFAWRLRHLLALAGLEGGSADLRRVVDGQPIALPPGCLVDVELEARDLLRELLPTGGGAVVEEYRRLRAQLDRRPTPTELLNRGVLPGTLRARHDHWFAFVAAEGDLDEDERAVLAAHGDWLAWVETTQLNRSWKMVVLRTLLDGGALLDGQDLVEHAGKARAYLLAHPDLRRDLEPNAQIPDHAREPIDAWARWWRTWPIGHCEPWLSVVGDRLRCRLQVEPRLRAALLRMTEEIVAWRLADYVERRLRPAAGSGEFIAKLTHVDGEPIIKLPDRSRRPDLPVGPMDVTLPDGSVWRFRFVKIACNRAHPLRQDAAEPDALQRLLRAWFGPQAGLPGTNHRVRFIVSPQGWRAEPLGQVSEERDGQPVDSVAGRPRGFVAELPEDADRAQWIPVRELAAAATAFSGDQARGDLGWVPRVAKVPDGAFLAQVRGRSMEPTIPDGAWCLFRPVGGGSREGKVLLVLHRGHADPQDGGRYTVKRYRSTKRVGEDGWEHASISLVPDNPGFPPIVVDEDAARELRVFAEFVRVWPAADHGRSP